jgi:hypothetical protein
MIHYKIKSLIRDKECLEQEKSEYIEDRQHEVDDLILNVNLDKIKTIKERKEYANKYFGNIIDVIQDTDEEDKFDNRIEDIENNIEDLKYASKLLKEVRQRMEDVKVEERIENVD